MKKLCMFFVVYAIAHVCYALDNQNNYTLNLTIINHSKETLHYTGVTGTHLGNTFLMSTNDILPGGSATVTGMTTPVNDLTGTLRFTDATGNVNLFKVIDYRQFHVGQPVFIINNDRFLSFVNSRTFNSNPNPRALSIVAAEVEVEDRFSSSET
ncbi:MAG: hypothetical protein ACD_45C00063G0005 [uncultured bacterium]|nr:MAG: hypothetical protein ACD_45C00063G0005 [uncultured bacterium]